MLTFTGLTEYMERVKRSFITISSILLYTLILSLLVRLFLTGELVTVSDASLILLAISRAIVLTLSFADIIRDKIKQPINNND